LDVFRYQTVFTQWNAYYNISIDTVEIKANLSAHLMNEQMKVTAQLAKPIENRAGENWLEAVRTQVSSLRFGVIQIVVHDARVVQIEKTEKIRFEKAGH
jgi:hypothetical protein